jgi:hypothetical protein
MDDTIHLVQKLLPLIIFIFFIFLSQKKPKNRVPPSHEPQRHPFPRQEPSSPPQPKKQPEDKTREAIEDILRGMGLPVPETPRPKPEPVPPPPTPTTRKAPTVERPRMTPGSPERKPPVELKTKPVPKKRYAEISESEPESTAPESVLQISEISASPSMEHAESEPAAKTPFVFESANDLQKAIVWSEILGKPVGLRENG